MPTDEQITFADHTGRFYARRYAFPPMVGRVLGYLLVCEPRDQTITELSSALLASRSAITGALDILERIGGVIRSRRAGERMDRVRIDFASSVARGFDLSEYEELGGLAREGLEVVAQAPAERKADLLRMAAFADFLTDRMRSLEQDWKAHEQQLIADGRLPGPDDRR